MIINTSTEQKQYNASEYNTYMYSASVSELYYISNSIEIEIYMYENTIPFSMRFCTWYIPRITAEEV